MSGRPLTTSQEALFLAALMTFAFLAGAFLL